MSAAAKGFRYYRNQIAHSLGNGTAGFGKHVSSPGKENG